MMMPLLHVKNIILTIQSQFMAAQIHKTFVFSDWAATPLEKQNMFFC